MSIVYALLFVVLAVGVQQSQCVDPKYANYPCDHNDVNAIMYPYYKDCSIFIQCKEGQLTDQRCPQGTVADFAVNNCVPAAGNKVLDCAKLTVGKGKRR